MARNLELDKFFKAGENLFEKGDLGKEAYMIKSGKASVWRMRNGHRVNLATLSEGDIVGEMGLIDDIPRSATVTARTDVTAKVLTKKHLNKLVNEAPMELRAILHQLFESMRMADDMIEMYADKVASMTEKFKAKK